MSASSSNISEKDLHLLTMRELENLCTEQGGNIEQLKRLYKKLRSEETLGKTAFVSDRLDPVRAAENLRLKLQG